MLLKTNANDQTTKVIIRVYDNNGKATDVDKISSFSMVIDILNLGDIFSITVPDPHQKWAPILIPGQPIKVFLSNPAVNNNAEVQIYDGLITSRKRIGDNSLGSIIQLECADKGWYLKNTNPKLWQQTTQSNYLELFKTFAGDPTWRFVDSSGNPLFLVDNTTSVKIRQGLSQGRAGAILEANKYQNLLCFRIQVEPGMTVASILQRYARNFGRLCNISPDGYFQIFTPNYSQTASYRIDYHDNSEKTKNNVLQVEIEEDIKTSYTKATVVGEIVGWYALDVNNPNTGKFYGTSTNPDVVPFTHEYTFTEGELYSQSVTDIGPNTPYANSAADWKLKSMLFDSFTATYKVRGHQQNGKYWTPDTMVNMNDTVNGIVGNYYISRIKLNRTDAGDITEITVKKPNLLTPYFKG